MKIELTPEEKQDLEDLLSQAHDERLALDNTLSVIEGIIGEEIDMLDEWVGNGIDADTLIGNVEAVED